MRPRINLSLQVAAGILALIAPCFLAAQGAPAVSLEEQLSAQYTLVKMGSDSSGPAVVEPGTILAIQKGGILGVRYGNAKDSRSEEHTSELQSLTNLVCRLLLEKKNNNQVSA